MNENRNRQRQKLIGIDAEYHCTSKLANKSRFFENDAVKEMVRNILFKTAYFHGVNIVTYNVMDNHVHIDAMISVKEQNKEITDNELIDRVSRLYSYNEYDKGYSKRVINSIKVNDGDSNKYRKDLKNRMGDISKFMQNFKQRVSRCYNGNYDNEGSIWDSRFKSKVTEYRSTYGIEMALYTDLNTVRAGLVDDPLKDRFCGYSEAVMDPNSEVRYNLMDLLQKDTWEEALADYRVLLFARGGKLKSDGTGCAIKNELVKKVIGEQGELSDEYIESVRVLHLRSGGQQVIGDKEIVERVMRQGLKEGEALPEAVKLFHDKNTDTPWYSTHKLIKKKKRKRKSNSTEG